MQNRNDIYELQVREQFKFLEEEYQFHVWEVLKNNYGCYITYKSPLLAVKVSNEIHEGSMDVSFYKLEDGKIPTYPIFFDPSAEFLVFSLHDLLVLRTGSFITQDWKRLYEDADYLKATVAKFAEAIKRHASDVLKGDFSVLPAIKRLVIRRAKELEHEM